MVFPVRGQRGARTAPQQRIAAIYAEIRYRICTSRCPPGTVLREEVLASEYSVSRSPIRRVFSMLEHEGLVEIKHGIGTIVTRIEPEALIDVYAVRMVLAASMGGFMVTPFPDGTRAFFERCAEEFLALERGDAIGFAETNIRFYTHVIELIDNATLREIKRNLFFQTSRMWLLLLPGVPWDEIMSMVHNEIAEIIRHVDANDPIGLAYAARNHIFSSQRWLLKTLPTG